MSETSSTEAAAQAGNSHRAHPVGKSLRDVDAAGSLALIGLVSALLLPFLLPLPGDQDRHDQSCLWFTLHLAAAALAAPAWRRARRSRSEPEAGPDPEDTRQPLPAALTGNLPPRPAPRGRTVRWPVPAGAPGYSPCLRRRFAWEWARPGVLAVPLRIPPAGSGPIRWPGRCGAGGRGRWPLARARGWWHPGFRPEPRRGLC